jgi:metallo-beta-lactamase family protein
MAQLTFLGAIEGVTGSCYLLQTESSRILLECGLVQGRHEEEEANANPFPFDPKQLDAVVLSHAHLDHSGRLPKLVADGYRGSIFMTRATEALLAIMLKDAAYLEERDIHWENKHRRRSGRPLLEPLFTLEDVEATLLQCDGQHYSHAINITNDVAVVFHDAGHILGSAIVEVLIKEQGREKRLVFSGDLGNSCAALLRDPEPIYKADVLLLESTYGDRDHRPMEETLEELEQIISHASQHGGNVLIPSFAVGRTQEIIFRLGELYHANKLDQLAVYLDSPMAIAATEVYEQFMHIYNAEDRYLIEHSHARDLESYLPILRLSRTTEESMALNRISEGAIIIAGSGMCNGGRIRHHFKHNLWRNNAHVIIVGYQAIGTPGRALVDGAKSLRIGGEDISVNAEIHTLGGFSAHASQTQLLNWAHQFHKPHPRLYLVHGETEAKQALQACFQQRNWQANIPQLNETIKF